MNQQKLLESYCKEAIILAGGLGTRLREAVPDLPKCMAPVAGRPFLFYVINSLRLQGVEKFIFSLGYRHEAIEEYLANQFATLHTQIVIEEEPLGTGGAIRFALEKATEDNVVIANGDTLFQANLVAAYHFHLQRNAACTLLLKPMQNFDRYGVVELTDDGAVAHFNEKQFYESGTINGGLYLLNVKQLCSINFPNKFSFEKEFLEKTVQQNSTVQNSIYGIVQDEYFIDIGIPEDFNKSDTDLATPPLQLNKIDKSWSLFLDRDGVINHDKPGSYIFNAAEFVFTEGAPGLFKKLNGLFGPIIVVTNQRGVGRGLITQKDLEETIAKMTTGIENAEGRIDATFYADAVNTDDPYRKPNPGMAFKAKQAFPAIDFKKSIMVGNKLSDMRFGKNAGMYTIFIASTNPETPFPHPDIDLRYNSLYDFVKEL